MRIISGEFKGRRISAPKQLPVRPTTDMAKESLFNILNNHYYFDEISVLDLFAGTGNISYEFASRGSQFITAVDAHYNCIKFINTTAEDFEMPITTIKSDVFSFLEQHSMSYDIIFGDPPYDFDKDQFLQIAELVFKNNLVSNDGQLIIEHSKHTDLSSHSNFRDSRHYGGSVFSFFENDKS